MTQLTSSAFAVLFLATPLFADTIVVDAGGGGDFNDLPAAVASAMPGDLLRILPGDYSGTGIGQSLTLIGGPGVTIQPGLFVQFLPVGERVVLADLKIVDLQLLNSDGTLVLDNVSGDMSFGSTPNNETLRVSDSTDVRARACLIRGEQGNQGARIIESRFESVSCTFTGGFGTESYCGSAFDGFAAIDVFRNSRMHLVHSSVTGGEGGFQGATCISFCGGLAGNGAQGIYAGHGTVEIGTDLIVAGEPTDVIQGGFAGLGETCDCDGVGGIGIQFVRGSLRRSGASVLAGGDLCTSGGPALVLGVATTETLPVPDDPTLSYTGTPMRGQTTTLVVRGPVGAKARLVFGLDSFVQPTPGTTIERLVSTDRVANLGTIPPAGQITCPIDIPNAAPFEGQTWFYQAEVSTGTGPLQRTNSVAVVIR